MSLARARRLHSVTRRVLPTPASPLTRSVAEVPARACARALVERCQSGRPPDERTLRAVIADDGDRRSRAVRAVRFGSRGGEARVDDLPDALRLVESPQFVGPEIDHPDGVRALADERRRKVREQDLAPLTHRHDACRSVDRPPEEVPIGPADLASVDPHAHPQPDCLHVPLRRDRRRDGSTGRGERGGDSVSHGCEDLALLGDDRGTEDREVLIDLAAHRRAFFPLTRRSLDVGEQEAPRHRLFDGVVRSVSTGVVDDGLSGERGIVSGHGAVWCFLEGCWRARVETVGSRVLVLPSVRSVRRPGHR